MPLNNGNVDKSVSCPRKSYFPLLVSDTQRTDIWNYRVALLSINPHRNLLLGQISTHFQYLAGYQILKLSGYRISGWFQMQDIQRCSNIQLDTSIRNQPDIRYLAKKNIPPDPIFSLVFSSFQQYSWFPCFYWACYCRAFLLLHFNNHWKEIFQVLFSCC